MMSLVALIHFNTRHTSQKATSLATADASFSTFHHPQQNQNWRTQPGATAILVLVFARFRFLHNMTKLSLFWSRKTLSTHFFSAFIAPLHCQSHFGPVTAAFRCHLAHPWGDLLVSVRTFAFRLVIFCTIVVCRVVEGAVPPSDGPPSSLVVEMPVKTHEWLVLITSATMESNWIRKIICENSGSGGFGVPADDRILLPPHVSTGSRRFQPGQSTYLCCKNDEHWSTRNSFKYLRINNFSCKYCDPRASSIMPANTYV